MNIAIDVHSLGTQAGGNETFYRQLLRGLAADRTANRYSLLHTHPFDLPAIEHDRRFTLHKIPHNPALRLGVSIPRFLRATKPDIFHCQYIQPLWGNRKTVVTIHDLAFEHFPEFFHPLETLRLNKLVRWTARKADHVLTVSEFSAADISRRYNLPPDKITVAYQSPSAEFRPRDKQQCLDHLVRTYDIRPPFILYVGRIQARKNLPRLVEAYARLKKDGLAATLVFVGRQDWQAEQLRVKIKALGLESFVKFTGFVPFEDVPLFYNAAELFVFPSLFEGFGLPVMESMASGIPTITSYGSALEEVAGDAALLVDPCDTASIASALEKVLSDRNLRERLVSRGLQRAGRFRPEDLVNKTLGIYRTVA